MQILNFQKPEKIILQKANEFEGTFEFKPLEPGYGVTIGNALRRVLLSSLDGYALSAIKINGVAHEFATIKGIMEDVTEIILNLKQVRVKKLIDETPELGYDKIFLSIKGREQFTAGDIAMATNMFEITNPDLIICKMEKSVHLEMEFIIQKGRGYVPAEETTLKDMDFGIMPIDAIYTPIKHVKYSIESTRVEQKTDYERLLLEVITDGTIHPEDAVKSAAIIMIEHLILISNTTIALDDFKSFVGEPIDEQKSHIRKLLKTSLEDLELSVRAYNCLKSARINSLSELVKYDATQIAKFRNFGKKSLQEIELLVTDKGLTFGMDVNKYINED